MSQLEKVLCTTGVFNHLRGHRMRRIVVLLIAAAALAGVVAWVESPHLNRQMERPPRSSWTKSQMDTATGS